MQLGLGILNILVSAFIAMWVGIDARDRGLDKGRAYAWAAGSFLLGMFIVCCAGPAIYLIAQNMGRQQPRQVANTQIGACRYCGQQILGDPAFCPHCSAQLKSADDIHRNKS